MRLTGKAADTVDLIADSAFTIGSGGQTPVLEAGFGPDTETSAPETRGALESEQERSISWRCRIRGGQVAGQDRRPGTRAVRPVPPAGHGSSRDAPGADRGGFRSAPARV